jgi:hypothetical protein
MLAIGKRSVVVGVALLGMLSGIATSVEAKRSESTSFCEQDRCVFGFAYCVNASGQNTGCNTGLSGLCDTYQCEPE